MADSVRKLLLLKTEFTVFCVLEILEKEIPFLFYTSAPQLSEDSTSCPLLHPHPSFPSTSWWYVWSLRAKQCDSITSLLSVISHSRVQLVFLVDCKTPGLHRNCGQMILAAILVPVEISLLFHPCVHPYLLFVKYLSAIFLSSNEALPFQPSVTDTLYKPAFHVLAKLLNSNAEHNNVKQDVKLYSPAYNTRNFSTSSQ